MKHKGIKYRRTIAWRHGWRLKGFQERLGGLCESLPRPELETDDTTEKLIETGPDR